jgi:hypothetical protein
MPAARLQRERRKRTAPDDRRESLSAIFRNFADVLSAAPTVLATVVLWPNQPRRD